MKRGGSPSNGGKKAARVCGSVARHHSVPGKGASWGCAAKAVGVPSVPKPPNSECPELAACRPKIGWVIIGKALDRLNGCSPEALNKCPQAVMEELRGVTPVEMPPLETVAAEGVDGEEEATEDEFDVVILSADSISDDDNPT